MAEASTELVALVAAPRSGTHFLQALLRDHPDVCFYSEVFHDRAKQPEGRDPDRPLAFFFQWLADTHGHRHLTGAGGRDIRWMVEYLAALRTSHDQAVVGVDLKYWTWSDFPPQYMWAIEGGIDRWIHLVRLDLVRAVVSDTLRQFRKEHPQLPADLRIRLPDPGAVLRAAQRRGERIATFRDKAKAWGAMEIVYEHLFDDPKAGGATILPAQQARLLGALGLADPGRPLRSDRRRSNPPDLGDVVENWGDVRAHVGPRLADWLTERGQDDLAAYSVGP